MDVSIIIVNYNTKELLKNCLSSIFEKTQNIKFEIFVVDNNSQDGSCEMVEQSFPDVNLIKNSDNKGFGFANNLAIKKAAGKYIFLLNSDTILLNDAVNIFFEFMENQENANVACCGGNLYDAKLQQVCSYGIFPTILLIIYRRFYFHKFLSKSIKNKLFPSFSENNDIKQVEYVTGADMFLRKSVLDEIGLFNEEFFLYYEDTELAFRIKRNDYKSVILPSAKIIHLEGASNESTPEKIKIIKESELLFFEKCYSAKHRNLIKIIQVLADIPMLFVTVAKLFKQGRRSILEEGGIDDSNIIH